MVMNAAINVENVIRFPKQTADYCPEYLQQVQVNKLHM